MHDAVYGGILNWVHLELQSWPKKREDEIVGRLFTIFESSQKKNFKELGDRACLDDNTPVTFRITCVETTIRSFFPLALLLCDSF